MSEPMPRGAGALLAKRGSARTNSCSLVGSFGSNIVVLTQRLMCLDKNRLGYIAFWYQGPERARKRSMRRSASSTPAEQFVPGTGIVSRRGLLQALAARGSKQSDTSCPTPPPQDVWHVNAFSSQYAFVCSELGQPPMLRAGGAPRAPAL